MSKTTGQTWKTILKVIAAIVTAILGTVGAADAMTW
ncbi:MAG: smalltalk protein [Prevotella sp.]